MAESAGSRRISPTLARLPPLTSLRAFVAAARHLSFAAAADELHVTSAAIGQQIRLLEDHLGRALFTRSRGKLQLTDAGNALMPGLTEAFDSVVSSIARMADNDGDAPLRLSVLPSFAGKWLVPRLETLQQAVPSLEIRLEASIRLVDFSNDDMDCAVRYGPGAYPGMVVDRLLGEAVVPVCSPDLAAELNLYDRPEALSNVPLLHDDGAERDPSCPDWTKWMRSAGLDINASAGIRFNQSAMVLDAAAAGQGVALAKLRLAEGDIEAGRLISPFGEPQRVDYSYYFVTVPHKASLSRVDMFRTWLRAEANAARAIDVVGRRLRGGVRLSQVAV